MACLASLQFSNLTVTSRTVGAGFSLLSSTSSAVSVSEVSISSSASPLISCDSSASAFTSSLSPFTGSSVGVPVDSVTPVSPVAVGVVPASAGFGVGVTFSSSFSLGGVVLRASLAAFSRAARLSFTHSGVSTRYAPLRQTVLQD